MFTSRKFDALTALLWGDRWWIEGRDESIPFGDLHRAAEVLLAQFADGDKPSRLRLIFQPASLAAISVACPKGNRETFQLALNEQFPALGSQNHAWGFEPIFGGAGPFATILYHEIESGLFALAQALRVAGIEIEGAWPLGSLLNLVPEEWPDSGAMTVVAVGGDHALVFRHMPDGRRDVQSATGPAAEALALENLRAALGRSDTAPFLVMLDPVGEQVLALLPVPDVPRVHLATWSRLVAAAATLSRRLPSQLLPSEPSAAPRRALLVASIAMALAALGLGADYVHAEIAWKNNAAANQRERATLRAEIESRRAAQEELTALREAVRTGAPAPAVFATLLRGLAAKLPRELVLTGLRVERATFACEGGVVSPISDAAWRAWIENIEGANARWTITAPAAVPQQDFRLEAKVRS